MNLLHEVAVIRGVADGCCTYCHRSFGSIVTWHGRRKMLCEEADHVIPKAIGGRVTVPSCSLCNRIKGALIFDSMADIQDYCIDRLLRDRSVTLQHANDIVVERSCCADSLSPAEIADTLECVTPDEQRLLSSEEIRRETRRIGDRTREEERHAWLAEEAPLPRGVVRPLLSRSPEQQLLYHARRDTFTLATLPKSEDDVG